MSVADSLTPEKIKEAFKRVKNNLTIDGGDIELITAERLDDMFEVLRHHFTPDEPLCKAFQVGWHSARQERFRMLAQENLTVMAVCEDTNELMGVLMNNVMKRSDPLDFSEVLYEPTRDLLKFMVRPDVVNRFYERYRADEALHCNIFAVNRKFRQKGLGSKLVAASVELGKELGLKAVYVEATSTSSQKCFEKNGFEMLHELKYNEYIYKGEPLSVRTGEHQSVKIYGKML